MAIFNMRFLFIGFFLSLIFQTRVAGQGQFNKLVWSDEFNYNGLPDSLKWNYEKGRGCPEICGWGNNELQFYTWRRMENATVQDGCLVIKARKEDFNDARYTSARLTSKNKGDWKYGRFEIRAKLPAGRGIWPAIWMMPTKWTYGNWPKSGEIDIMEHVGYLPDSVFGTVHTDAYNGMIGTQKTKGIAVRNLSDSFHVYTAEWTSSEISFFVDGIKYNVFKNDLGGSKGWPFDQEFHLILNIAVGGNWGGKHGIDETIFPQQMEIDYVRVYQ